MDHWDPPVVEKGEQLHFVADGAAYARLNVNGDNIVRRGHTYEHIPRLSRPDFGSLVFGTLPADDISFDEKVSSVIMPDLAKKFRQTKKVVKQPRSDGLYDYTLVPNVPDVTYEPIEDYSDVQSDVGVLDTVPRQYSLAQFFFDSYVIEKFRLSSRILQTVKRLAVTNPAEAARVLESHIARMDVGHPVKVIAGEYSRSKKKCIANVWEVTRPYKPVTVAVTATVVEKKVFLHQIGPERGWSVEGPSKYLPEIQAIYHMVAERGTAEPMFLLGMELTLLQIDIYNGHAYESPSVVGHVGAHGIEARPSPIYATYAESVTVDQRWGLERVKQRVRAVTSSDGTVVASSVRLTDRHVLLNEHVVNKVADAMVDSQPFQLVKVVSRDMWVAKSIVSADTEPWKLRPPRVGEQCVLIYSIGSTVEISSPVQVISYDGINIFITKVEEARYGVSGAALVSVDDASLFGIYLGETQASCICASFGQTQFTDVVELDALSQVARQHASSEVSDSIYTSLKSRGLHKVVDAAIMSMDPMYHGNEHCGMSVMTGAGHVTTLDPDSQQLELGFRGTPLVFQRISNLQFRSRTVGTGAQESPAFSRFANPRERVFVVGRDDEGPYFSDITSVVHVGVGGKTFSLAELPESQFPYTGGLVVALSDAAVLGQFVGYRATMADGNVAYCAALEIEVASTLSLTFVEHLAAKFPMLSPTSWPDEAVEEAITHSSVHEYASGAVTNSGNLPLAAIGDAAASLCLRIRLRENETLHSKYGSIIQELHTNAKFNRLAWEFGIASYCRFGRGVSLPATSKVYADMFEALVGLVYLYETRDTFVQFCEASGIVPPVTYTLSPVESRD